MMVDTIFAPAAPAGGAISIIRISGPKSLDALKLMAKDNKEFAQRRLYYCSIYNKNKKIDEAMCVFFASPNSYTGEDMAEVHCHGSLVVIREVCSALSAAALRPALPGEFTKRAFLNGKMDLIKAEAVMDIINAEADLSLKAALSQLGGELGRQIKIIENMLIEALSDISATIDYPDELEEDVLTGLPHKLNSANESIISLIQQGNSGRVLREGFFVAITGLPNAGKSSLFNALLGDNRAIVTSSPGTTRDTLEEHLELSGLPVIITDTAGIREATDEAEEKGVLRAKMTADRADALLVLLDTSKALSKEDLLLLEQTKEKKRLVLLTKCDSEAKWNKNDLPLNKNEKPICLSVVTQQGLEELKKEIPKLAGPVGGALVTNQRHFAALKAAKDALDDAVKARDIDCASTDIRDALMALGSITGNAVDERVIEDIFKRFCVGK